MPLSSGSSILRQLYLDVEGIMLLQNNGAYELAWCNIIEGVNPHQHCCENLRSCKQFTNLQNVTVDIVIMSSWLS